MMTESHIHILPKIDDGSESVEMSLKLLEMLKEQGIEQIYATPHFYAHREKSVRDFLQKRQKSYEKMGSPENIHLGAEIAIEHGISELPDLEKLAFQGTNLILLEFPYTGYSSWMEDEIYNISAEYKLKPVIAHIHRYMDIFSREHMNSVLKMKAIFQVNNETFGSFKQRNFVRKLIKNGYPIIFGSDSHNLLDRKPNWELLRKKVSADILENSEKILEAAKR
ncbi:MAG: capsular polysaccharide biosynthesis protein [Ruminococcus flavefaciens]|nr:capsular polysaccharide biosynthesis protein [Ruminococcus flavefaciens]